MVAGSNKSRVVFEKPGKLRLSRPANDSVKSNLDVPASIATDSTCNLEIKPEASAFWKRNITWNRGLRPRSRSGFALLNQLFEWEILMDVRTEARIAASYKKLLEAWVPRKIRAQNKRVNKKSYQPLNLSVTSVGNRGTNNDIFLARVSVEQNLERC